MSESLFSPLWYRVSNLKPQLQKHVSIQRHDYRGMIWYILDDKASGRSHRFNSTAYQVIGLLDGKLTVDRIWNIVNDRLGDFAPTQDQMIQLLGKLYHASLLKSDHAVDTNELFKRSEQQTSSSLKQRLFNPLSVKIPLWDPDVFLRSQFSKVFWLFHWYTGLAIALLIALAGLSAVINWQAINANLATNMLSPYNLAIMVVLYPVIKFMHELGHAFSARFYGGEVHEMGVSFLVFMPIPYVDVSSVNALRSKQARIIISAAGILVELILASLGCFLWLNSEPGLINDIAFNTMIIGSVSSLFFNGNPLLKYDAYYMVADGLGIPNLYRRSGKFIVYLCQKYLFGMEALSSPATSPGEPGWFVVYGIGSFVYRLGLLWFIVIYLIDNFFVVGVLLAGWSVFSQILWPLIKGLNYVINSASLQRHRYRAVTCIVFIITLFTGVVFGLKVPSYTLSEGVVWMPEESQLRAETTGFASKLLVSLPTNVEKNTAILNIDDPLLKTEEEVLLAKLRELNAQFRAEWEVDQVKAGNIKNEMIVMAEELKEARKKSHAMKITAQKAGKLLIPDVEDLPGKFVRQGEVIGYVVDDMLPTIRVAITQSDIGQIQKQVKKVEVRLVNQPDHVIPATIIRRSPEATNFLFSPALAAVNGGKIAIDPESSERLTTREKVFQIDLQFKPIDDSTVIGQRVYVRFDHGTETLAQQWYRSLRQVFLRQFNV